RQAADAQGRHGDRVRQDPARDEPRVQGQAQGCLARRRRAEGRALDMGMDVGTRKGPRSDINITPLVDVVLVLLIIFMVLTPLREKEIGVRVPEEVPPDQVVEPPPPDLTQVVFKVDEAGNFHINNETLTDDNLMDRLKAYYKLAKSKEATQGPPVIF